MVTPQSRQRARQAFAVFLLIAVGAGALALASSARLEPADFTFNNGTEVTTLDPATVTGVPEGRVIRAIFEGLVVKDPETLEPVPGMAESWLVSEDGLTYTFNIRQNAKWSNGDPVTAEDFVYSFERFLNPATAAEYAYQLWYVKGARDYTTKVGDDGKPTKPWDSVGIRALDRFTLEMVLHSPTPFFMDLMGFYPLFPVNRRNIEEAREQFPKRWTIEWLKPENIVTNGPYKVDFRRVNDRIRLVKNPDYWDADNVAFETIDALAIEQWTTGLNFYLTGGCHWVDKVPPTAITELLKREDFRPRPYLGTYFYRVNVTRAPGDDPRIRRALSLTIDRRKICEKITKAGQVPAYGLVPPGMKRYVPAEAEKEDVERARVLLAEAGYGPGGKPLPTIEIHYNTSETHRDIAEFIGDTWKRELGLNVKYLNQEWKVYLDTQQNLQYDVSRAAWIGDYNEPNTFLDMFVTDGENNKTGWGNPEYDRLIESAAREFDPEKRMEILRSAEEILVSELPILPIYFYVTQNVVHPRLGGFHYNVQDEHFPKFWYWMDEAELAKKREAYRREFGRELERVDTPIPHPNGLYSPAARRARLRGPR